MVDEVFIDVLEDFKSGGQTYRKGEKRLIAKPLADSYCGRGWAYSKDCKSGERKPGAVKLEVKDGIIGVEDKPPTWRKWIGGK